jgi:hypothetical protein
VAGRWWEGVALLLIGLIQECFDTVAENLSVAVCLALSTVTCYEQTQAQDAQYNCNSNSHFVFCIQQVVMMRYQFLHIVAALCVLSTGIPE